MNNSKQRGRIKNEEWLRSTDGFASRTAVITAQQGNVDRQTQIANG
jgi:hypothetical protein